MDRRTTLKWMLAAAATPFLKGCALMTDADTALAPVTAKGYGTDPDLMTFYKPGDIWPLTLSQDQRLVATSLCDLIVPRHLHSPAASEVGVVDFIDEWISAPYPNQQEDRVLILRGFEWLNREGADRFGRPFADLGVEQRTSICDEICYLPRAKPAHLAGAKFFARYRDLTAGGYYTTPAGWKEIGYVGNVALSRFDGPPLEVLRKVGLA